MSAHGWAVLLLACALTVAAGAVAWYRTEAQFWSKLYADLRLDCLSHSEQLQADLERLAVDVAEQERALHDLRRGGSGG